MAEPITDHFSGPARAVGRRVCVRAITYELNGFNLYSSSPWTVCIQFEGQGHGSHEKNVAKGVCATVN